MTRHPLKMVCLPDSTTSARRVSYLLTGAAGVTGGIAAGVPVGAGAGACFGTVCCVVPPPAGVSTIEEGRELGPWRKASSKEVNMKITATAVVNLVRKVEAPLLPKMV